jgi:hypothetical protein
MPITSTLLFLSIASVASASPADSIVKQTSRTEFDLEHSLCLHNGGNNAVNQFRSDPAFSTDVPGRYSLMFRN